MALLNVTVESGKISGLPAGNQGISIFKGIPYADPPVGDLRWRAPQPVKKWEGEMKAYSYSDIPMQCRVPEESIYKKEFYPVDLPRSENCLYLNIWTPAKTSDEKLPVALWIYGGGFVQGYSNKMETDGEAFAKRGVIYVSFNYRLNVFGFLSHPELSDESKRETGIKTSGNYGMMDQIAALKWVRKNIKAFGGDPDKITLFGQSAGAMSVQTLISSKLTEGDIDKAIMQSAAGIGMLQKITATPLEEAEKCGEDFLESINVSNIEEARTIPAEKLINHFSKAISPEGLSYNPVVDGYILEDDLISLAVKNKFPDIPTMIGCAADDLTFSGVSPKDTIDTIRSRAETIYEKHTEQYLNISHGDDVDAYSREMNDKNDIYNGCLAWCKLQNKLGRQPAYQYYFNHPVPESNIGTFHSSEHMYVFQTFLRGWRAYSGVDFDLSNRMCGYWTNFIKYGNPNGKELPVWLPYTAENPTVMELNINGGVRSLPKAELADFESDYFIGNLD